MANPTAYTQSYDFSAWQEGHPAAPLPADQLDNELANIETAVASNKAAIRDVRRSDGHLKNAIVTTDSLSPAVLALIAAGGSGGSGGGTSSSVEYLTPQDYQEEDKTDDWTEAIQAALDAAQLAGIGAILIPPGQYPITGVGEIHGAEDKVRGVIKLRSGVSIVGTGATLTMSGGRTDGPGLFFQAYWDEDTELNDVHIIGLTLDGGASENTYVGSYQYQHGIQFFNGKNCKVIDCTIHNFNGSGVMMGRAETESDDSSKVVGFEVAGCEFYDCWREGCFVPACDGGSIHDNYFHGYGYLVAAIDLERHLVYETVNNVKVYSNHFDFTDGLSVTIGGQPNVHYRRAVSVGFFYDGYDDQVIDYRFDGHQIFNNTIKQGQIDVWGATNVLIQGNSFTNTYEDISTANRKTPHAIHVDDGSPSGIDDLANVRILDNVIKSDMAGNGIYVSNYDNVFTNGNFIDGSRLGGIVYENTGGAIRGNDVRDVGTTGSKKSLIQLAGDCKRLIIAENILANTQLLRTSTYAIEQLDYNDGLAPIICNNIGMEVTTVWKEHASQTNYALAYNNTDATDGLFKVNATLQAYDIIAVNSFTIGAGDSGVTAILDGAEESDRRIRWRTAGSERWLMMVNDNAESGSNAGSDFRLVRYADDGTTLLGYAVKIDRDSGNTTLDNGNLTIAGSYTKPLIMNGSYLWVTAGKLYINTSAPTTSTDGTVVGTQS